PDQGRPAREALHQPSLISWTLLRLSERRSLQRVQDALALGRTRRRASAEPASAPTIASTTSVQSCQSKPEPFAGFPTITSVIRRPSRKPMIAPTMPPRTTIGPNATPPNLARQGRATDTQCLGARAIRAVGVSLPMVFRPVEGYKQRACLDRRYLPSMNSQTRRRSRYRHRWLR